MELSQSEFRLAPNRKAAAFQFSTPRHRAVSSGAASTDTRSRSGLRRCHPVAMPIARLGAAAVAAVADDAFFVLIYFS